MSSSRRSRQEQLTTRRDHLDAYAETLYTRLVTHLSECNECRGHELEPDSMCPLGRYVYHEWSRAERLFARLRRS